MGGGGSRVETRDYNCLSDPNIKIRKEPIKFNNLKHVRCLFLTQETYKAKYHIPKSTLTLEFNSTIQNLENDIEMKIKETYETINNTTRIDGGADIKILSPIYVAFSRKLEYESNLFDDNDIKKIEVNDINNKKYELAIGEYITRFLEEMNNPEFNAKYKSLPMNTYGFKNGQIYVILYFPFITSQYKYITNFKDIIKSSSFFIKTITNTSFNGLPDVSTVDPEKLRQTMEQSKQKFTPEYIDEVIANAKDKDQESFRYGDDLTYLCNEGGCISDVGEDFSSILPSLAANDSDNNNSAEKMAPFLPSKCLAQTVRYKCGVIGADKNNKSMKQIMKDDVIINYLKDTLRDYIINYNCTINKDKMDEQFCKSKADPKADIQQTPIDIISYAFSYQLRKKFSSDLNEGDKNHYSKSYNTHIIKELMLLRNKYPGIQEIVFPLYIYNNDKNGYLATPPWGSLFLTKDQIFYQGDPIITNRKVYSFNNNFYLTMNDNGYIYVANSNSNSILYYLNIIPYHKPINFTINDNISIFFKDKKGKLQTANLLKNDMKIIRKDDKHREPFDFYINDEGKLRVYGNGFIDATDKSFIKFIDDKIDEYENYGNSPNYLTSFNSRNEMDKNKLNLQEQNPIYIDY